MMPVMMGEYGDKNLARDTVALKEDLDEIMSIVKDPENPFFAFNYFQFAVSYWKQCKPFAQSDWDEWIYEHWNDAENFEGKVQGESGKCDERMHGTFGYGLMPASRSGHVDAGEKDWPIFDVPCLVPIFEGKPQAIAEAYGGTVPNTSLCRNDWLAQMDMRVASTTTESSTSNSSNTANSSNTSTSSKSSHKLRSVAKTINIFKSNVTAPPKYCIASRSEWWKTADALRWLCGYWEEKGMDCEEGLPEECSDLYGKADWAFSKWFAMKQGGKVNDETLCGFGKQGVLTAIVPRPHCTQHRVPATLN